jgi:hypothetical protein
MNCLRNPAYLAILPVLLLAAGLNAQKVESDTICHSGPDATVCCTWRGDVLEGCIIIPT